VKLPLLLRSLRNVLWRQEPVVYPEPLKHRVDAEGRHHFELVLEASEVESDLPKPRATPAPTPSTARFGEPPRNDE